MEKQFSTMDECKKELLLKDPDKGTFDVMWEFIEDTGFKYDWLAAGCKNEETGEEFILEPSYPKGKPKELIGIDIIPGLQTWYPLRSSSDTEQDQTYTLAQYQ